MTSAEWQLISRTLFVLIALMHACRGVEALERIAWALEKSSPPGLEPP